MVRRFRADDPNTPVVLMGYLNPIEVMGYGVFAERAREAGVDGALVVDVPPEESHDLVVALRGSALDLVYLLAPTSTEARIRKIAAVASGFVYYVSVKGVTGAGHLDVASVAGQARRDPPPRYRLPVGVGFGIKDAATAARVAALADAVIVGSAIVGRIEALAAEPADPPAAPSWTSCAPPFKAWLTERLAHERRSAIDALSRGAGGCADFQVNGEGDHELV
jgi:tryptophan synthase alpha chain